MANKKDDQEQIAASQKLVPVYDFSYLQLLDAEVYNRYMYDYQYFPLDLEATNKDGLYNESSQKVFKPSFLVPTFVDRNPRSRTLTKFGFDTPRDMLIVFSNKIIQAFDPPFKPKMGDRILVDDALYQISEVHAGDRFPNTNLRFHTACTADKYREDHISTTNPSAEFISKDEDLYRKI